MTAQFCDHVNIEDKEYPDYPEPGYDSVKISLIAPNRPN